MLIPTVGNTSSAPLTGSGRVVSDAPKVVSGTPDIGTPQAKQIATPGQLHDAVGVINLAMQKSHQSLSFSVDSATKTPVVKMTDTETGQIISQFPSEAALAIAHAIDQIHPGLLLKQQA